MSHTGCATMNQTSWPKPCLYLHQVELERRGQSGGKVQEGDGLPMKPAEDGFVLASKKCPWHNMCSLWERELNLTTELLRPSTMTSHIIVLGPNMSEAAVHLLCPVIKRETDQEVGLEASDLEKLQRLNDLRKTLFQEAAQLLLDIEDANSARKEQGQGHVFSDIQESDCEHWDHFFSPLCDPESKHDIALPKIFGEASRNRQRLIGKLVREWLSLVSPRAFPLQEPSMGSPGDESFIFMQVLEYVVRSPFHKADPTLNYDNICNFRAIERYPVVFALLSL